MISAKTSLVFPGQGAQKIGMGADFAQHGAARALFEEADDVLQFNLSKLMFEGEQDTLNLTENTQPALLLAGVAALKVLEDEAEKTVPELCAAVAGHSLGEYTALVAAGVLSFADGIRLVRLRGQAMQKAVPVGKGKMAASLGLDNAQVADVAKQCGVFVANDNSNGQVVLSGEAEKIDAACVALKEAGARRAVVLPVSAPFHCPLMAPAADVMAEAFEGTTFNKPVVPVVANVTAAYVNEGDAFKQLLTEQVTGGVRWRESMVAMAENDITQLIELGCGNVLSGLASRCDERLAASPMRTVEDIKNFLAASKAA